MIIIIYAAVVFLVKNVMV